MNANTKKSIGTFFYKYWLLLFTALVLLGFGALAPATLGFTNLLNIASNACLTAITGIGATCTMCTGDFDLSTGSILTMGCFLMVLFVKDCHMNYFLAIFLTLVCCALLGLMNALIHVKLRVPAFCTTFSTQFILTGLAKLIFNGTAVLGLSNGTVWYFTFLGQTYLWGVIPITVIILIIVSAVMIFFTEHTRSGKYLYAVGANPEACTYLGIDSGVQKYKGYIIGGLLCGLAGIIDGSMINGCDPSLGASMMNQASMVVMIGAMFNKVGVFNIPGTIIGALLISIITNGLVMVGTPSYVKDWVLGILLFASIGVVNVIRKRIAK